VGNLVAVTGPYLNNRRVTAADAVAAESDLLYGRYLVLRPGKRTVGGVEVVGRHA
jgi:tyrosyl-tRNA synthetase